MQKLLLISLILLCGCKFNRYVVDVKAQSISQTELSEFNMCEIQYFSPNINPKSIDGREFNRQIERVLTDRGIQITDSKKANCTIGIAYAVDGPYKQSHSVPIRGVTGTESSTSYTTGHISSYGNTAYGSATTHTYNTPRYGVTGYRHYDTYYYVQWLALAAINKNGEEIWNAKVSTEDTSDDLHAVFPLLSYIASDTIMTNTQTSINISSIKAAEIRETMTESSALEIK